MPDLDILYLSWNRREFTEFSWGNLRENTDWGQVRKLFIYDDHSTDGTAEFMREQVDLMNGHLEVVYWSGIKFGSPVAIMNHYLAQEPAEVFAKIDNDIVVPPDWLPEMLGVLERNPEIELLGMEAGMTGPPNADSPSEHTWEPSSHIGGVGLMRSSAFLTRRRMIPVEHFGFTEWQHNHPELRRGWIKPDLQQVELGRMPIEPWRSLTQKYLQRRWQRPWAPYHERWSSWYWEWWADEAGS
jgi:hypothetical protein